MAAVEDAGGSSNEGGDAPPVRTETNRGYKRGGDNDKGKHFVDVSF